MNIYKQIIYIIAFISVCVQGQLFSNWRKSKKGSRGQDTATTSDATSNNDAGVRGYISKWMKRKTAPPTQATAVTSAENAASNNADFDPRSTLSADFPPVQQETEPLLEATKSKYDKINLPILHQIYGAKDTKSPYHYITAKGRVEGTFTNLKRKALRHLRGTIFEAIPDFTGYAVSKHNSCWAHAFGLAVYDQFKNKGEKTKSGFYNELLDIPANKKDTKEELQAYDIVNRIWQARAFLKKDANREGDFIDEVGRELMMPLFGLSYVNLNLDKRGGQKSVYDKVRDVIVKKRTPVIVLYKHDPFSIGKSQKSIWQGGWHASEWFLRPVSAESKGGCYHVALIVGVIDDDKFLVQQSWGKTSFLKEGYLQIFTQNELQASGAEFGVVEYNEEADDLNQELKSSQNKKGKVSAITLDMMKAARTGNVDKLGAYVRRRLYPGFNGDLVRRRLYPGFNGDLTIQDGEGNTLLMTASRNGQVEFVKALLEMMARQQHQNRFNPLLLEKSETIVNRADNRGFTPLLTVCSKMASLSGKKSKQSEMKNLVDVALVLIDHGADVKCKDEKSGNTALMLASKSGNLNLVQALIVNGADVHATNNQGQTALSIPGASKHDLVVRELVAAGAVVPKALADSEAVARGHKLSKLTLEMQQRTMTPGNANGNARMASIQGEPADKNPLIGQSPDERQL